MREPKVCDLTFHCPTAFRRKRVGVVRSKSLFAKENRQITHNSMFADEHLKFRRSKFQTQLSKINILIWYKAKPVPRQNSDQCVGSIRSRRRTTPATPGPLTCGPLSYEFPLNCQTIVKRGLTIFLPNPVGNSNRWAALSSADFVVNCNRLDCLPLAFRLTEVTIRLFPSSATTILPLPTTSVIVDFVVGAHVGTGITGHGVVCPILSEQLQF